MRPRGSPPPRPGTSSSRHDVRRPAALRARRRRADGVPRLRPPPFLRHPSLDRPGSVGDPARALSRTPEAPLQPCHGGAERPPAIQLLVRKASAAHLRRAVLAACWFEQTHDDRTGKWLYGFRWRVVRTRLTLRAPWASAMAQGQAISLLVRVYLATGRSRHLLAAVRALRPLRRSLRRGGLTARLNGRPWYEEYPTSPPSFVLTGSCSRCWGSTSLAAVAPRSAAPSLYRQGLRTLVASPHLYDTQGGSRYHLVGRPYVAPLHYQRLHVKLLSALHEISPDTMLRRYRDRWRRSGISPPTSSSIVRGASGAASSFSSVPSRACSRSSTSSTSTSG